MKNNTPAEGYKSNNSLWMENYESDFSTEESASYNDLLNNSQFVSPGYNKEIHFNGFEITPYSTLNQIVYIDIPNDAGATFENNQRYKIYSRMDYPNRDDENKEITLTYKTKPSLTISSGVYTKHADSMTSTDINDYKYLNLNYYTKGDDTIYYYAYVHNDSKEIIDLSKYSFYIDYSDNQEFRGLCTIDDKTKIPTIVESNVVTNTKNNTQLFTLYKTQVESGEEIEVTSTVQNVTDTSKLLTINKTDLNSGEGFYIIYALSIDDDTNEKLESTVSIVKNSSDVEDVRIGEESVAYQDFIENGYELYTIDELKHSKTIMISNYEKTRAVKEKITYVTTPNHQNMLMWSGVYLLNYIPFKVGKSISTFSGMYGSGENANTSICFSIDAFDISGDDNDNIDKSAFLYDVLQIDTTNFEEGKNITDYFVIEPEINVEDYLLNKDLDDNYYLSDVPRLLVDNEKVGNISIKFFDGDLINASGDIDFSKITDISDWKDEICYSEVSGENLERVAMRIEVPKKFKNKVTFRYKLFAKDEIKNIKGIVNGENRARAYVTYAAHAFTKDTNIVPFKFSNKRVNKDLKVTNVVLNYSGEPSEEYKDVDFTYKVYKINRSAYTRTNIETIDLSRFEYLFSFKLKSTEEKTIFDAFKENNMIYDIDSYYLVKQEEEKFFATTVSCTYSGDEIPSANAGKYNVAWDSMSNVSTIDYVNRYNSLFDGSTQTAKIVKKIGYYYDEQIVSEDLPSGEIVRFNLLDDDGNEVKFVDLDIKDDDGAHYRVANSGDLVTTNEISTHKGKIVIDGLYKYIPYKLVELTTIEGYEPLESSLDIIITSGDGAYNTNVYNLSKYNEDTHIIKVDMSGDLIVNGKAIFNVTKINDNNSKYYFKYLGEIDGENCYEMVGATAVPGAVTDLETLNGKIKLVKMPIDTYSVNEIQSPEGYTRTHYSYYLNVKSAMQKAVCKFPNPKIIDFQLIKKKCYDLISNTIYTDYTIEDSETTFYAYNLYSTQEFFVKLNIQDESGEHYRLAKNSDDASIKTQYITTYKGKLVIEGLSEEDEFRFYEYKAPNNYAKSSFGTKFSVRDRIGNFYNSPLTNLSTYINKQDMKGYVITSDTAKFEITNSGDEKLYFKRHEDLSNCSVYELVGTEKEDNCVSELETYLRKN